MTTRHYGRLLDEISGAFSERFPRSASIQREACRSLVDGGSHTMRLIRPFPPRVVSAHGGWVRDEDGHDVLDLWQGHMGNILGHNPEVVTSELARGFADGFGLQVGMTDRLQAEVAEILCRQTGADRVRLTTSGTLAGMQGVMLARAFTGRDLVLKVGGGWHGAHPWSLKGAKFCAEKGVGFGGIDSEGLPEALTDDVIVTPFNDLDRLHADFLRFGFRLACFVVEPLIGAGGLIPATREYLQLARQLTHEYGTLLILDEVVNGFRFRAGNLAHLYGVAPDLAVYGKAIGGGMPVAALAGREDVMNLAGRAGGGRVAVFGGTYCAHPAAMLAAKVFMSYLVEHEDEIYPKLADLGQRMRNAIETGFSEEGVFALCTGNSPDLPAGSSLIMVHFPFDRDSPIDTPQAVFDPAVCDVKLRTEILGPALLLEDVHLLQGYGSAATTHTDEDIEFLQKACRRVARRIKPYLN